jgi:hypothetical protein
MSAGDSSPTCMRAPSAHGSLQRRAALAAPAVCNAAGSTLANNLFARSDEVGAWMPAIAAGCYSDGVQIAEANVFSSDEAQRSIRPFHAATDHFFRTPTESGPSGLNSLTKSCSYRQIHPKWDGNTHAA